MASKTRRITTKASEENIGVGINKTKIIKVARKPLSDKTNSASDDNASIESDKLKKHVASVPLQINDLGSDNVKRPRRARRLPTRYKENNTLKNLSNSQILSPSKQDSPGLKTPSPVLKKTKIIHNAQKTNNPDSNLKILSKKKISPLQTKTSPLHKLKVTQSEIPVKNVSSSILTNRPKRICRLPSKYKDHSISPNKYLPLHPNNASTPVAIKKKNVINTKIGITNISAIENSSPLKLPDQSTVRHMEELSAIQIISPDKKEQLIIKNKIINHGVTKEIIELKKQPKRRTRVKKVCYVENSINDSPAMPKTRGARQKAISSVGSKTVAADTNNNAKKNYKETLKSPGASDTFLKSKNRIFSKNNCLKLLDDNKGQLKRHSSKLDIYEFTFDPNEEPPPAKKKKKKVAQRKPKAKTVLKSNYEKNLAKALADLKNTIAIKSSNPKNGEINKNVETATVLKEKNNVDNNHIHLPVTHNCLSVDQQSILNEKNYNSVRVEDIARDFHMDEDDHAVDYSPVNSPSQLKTPTANVCGKVQEQAPNNVDPLNLQDDSFFDEIPVASSSINASVRHPQASPWRAEFGSLPIKWQVNTYVKPNMTPAFESSFINFNDTKEKHVYTNMVPEADDPIPQVDNSCNLKQTSIISFIKEVIEKNANKKSKKLTPIKANSLFEDLTSTSIVHNKTPNKETPFKNKTNVIVTPVSGKQENRNRDMSNEKENTENCNAKTPKDLNKNTDVNNTYFGFDEIEDQENMSAVKKDRVKSLRSRTRGILQELNEDKGPTRAVVPVAAKTKHAQITASNVNEMKSATEPPVFPEVDVDDNIDTTKVQESCVSEDDDQSVHLFEDIDLLFIHHPKPSRKSYGKAKKVTFIRNPVAKSDDSSLSDRDVADKNASSSSEEDNFDDLSFKLPTERPKRTIKKRKPKKQLSKKEEKEAEAWAAGFNSMCEDIDGFDLVVE